MEALLPLKVYPYTSPDIRVWVCYAYRNPIMLLNAMLLFWGFLNCHTFLINIRNIIYCHLHENKGSFILYPSRSRVDRII